IKYHIESPEDLNRNLDEVSNAFAAGRFATFSDSTLRFEATREKFQFPKDDILCSLYPSFDGKNFTPSQVGDTWNLVINSKSQATDQAWLLSDEWFSKEGDQIWMEQGGQGPMLASSADSPILNSPQKAYLKPVLEKMKRVGSYLFQNIEGEDDIIPAAFQEVVNGAPIVDTLKKAQDQYHKILDEAQKK